MNWISRAASELILVGLLLVLFVTLSIVSDSFFTVGNLFQVARQMVELAIITCGMAAVVISGGIDLSIGAIVGLSAIVMGVLMVAGTGMWVALLVGLIVAVLAGILNGVLIGYLRVPAIIATLGTALLFTGIAVVLSEGKSVSGFPSEYFFIGQSFIGLIPSQVLIMIAVIAISVVMLSYSRWGRRVYLIGSNPVAARFSGIRTNRVLLATYVYASLMAFIVAVILSSRTATARTDLGDSYVLSSISAVVIGGISIFGGRGSLLGAIAGVAVFTVISNGMDLLGYSVFLQNVVIGLTLILVLSVRAASPMVRKRLGEVRARRELARAAP